MKTYNQINDKIASGKAVVLTAEEMKDYIDKYGVRKAAKEIDVVTTATLASSNSAAAMSSKSLSKANPSNCSHIHTARRNIRAVICAHASRWMT